MKYSRFAEGTSFQMYNSRKSYLVFSDAFGGDGNSFYAVGGRGNKRAQMRHCLRLMKCMTATGDENILQDFTDQGAINQLTGQSLHIVDSEH